MQKYRDISLEDVKRVYLDTPNSGQQAAKLLNISYSTFRRALKLHGIPGKGIQSKNPYLRDKAWLKKAYVDDKKSLSQIAHETGASRGAVNSALRHIRVQMRSVSEGINTVYPGGRFGERSAHWKGGKYRTHKGYVYVKRTDHPAANREGYVMEHRLVMEQLLGRYLEPHEMVHHKNRRKDDNRPENLQLVSSHKEHSHTYFEAAAENDELRQKLQRYEEKYGKLD